MKNAMTSTDELGRTDTTRTVEMSQSLDCKVEQEMLSLAPVAITNGRREQDNINTDPRGNAIK